MVRGQLQVSATLPMVFTELEAFVVLFAPKNIIFYIASNVYVPILNTEKTISNLIWIYRTLKSSYVILLPLHHTEINVFVGH